MSLIEIEEVDQRFPEKLAPLFENYRNKIIKGGRGSAKSWSVAGALLLIGQTPSLLWKDGSRDSSGVRIACGREVQNSINESVYQLLVDTIHRMELHDFYVIRATEIVAFNGPMASEGTKFTFHGLRALGIANIKSLEGYDILWAEEAHVITKRSWDVVTPTIRKPQSEIWITFNPELDTDETYVRFVENPPPNSVVIDMNWRDNPWFPDVLELERQATQARDQEDYDNIWEGKPRSAVAGAIYAKEIAQLHAQGRVRPLPYDPMLAVHTIWDLGWNDKIALIFGQRASSEVRIIDYWEDSHYSYAKVVGDILEGRDPKHEHRRVYRYGSHWLPWDGGFVKLQTGVTDAQSLEKLGLRNVNVLDNVGVEEGIKQVRNVFPRVYIDSGERCRVLLNHLKRYKRVIPVTTGEPGAPAHDAASHGSDALRGLSLCVDKWTNHIKSGPAEDYYKALRR